CPSNQQRFAFIELTNPTHTLPFTPVTSSAIKALSSTVKVCGDAYFCISVGMMPQGKMPNHCQGE
ncbi:MAG: hypothetical protein RRA51_07440, partial [Armatimonadota bacterium]|nr:hypothetical protein [Armatimonadota bacterium]